MRPALIALLGVLMLGAGAPPLWAQDPAAERDMEIRPLRGNLYQVRDGHEHTVFLVTTEGIVLVDPLSRPAAMVLREQLEARFPDVPVRYVVLTHHHADRSEGAGVFDQAQLVAQRLYPEQLARSRRSDEADYRFVRSVRDPFNRRRTIRLGDSAVQLAHVRSAHAPEMVVVYFDTEGVLFAVAPPPVTTAPFTFDAFRPGEVFGWIEVVAAMAPDLLLFDNGVAMEGAALQQLAQHLLAIRTDVAAAYERGLALHQIQEASRPAPEAGVSHDALRAAHIAAVYGSLRLVRIELSGRVMVTYTSRNSPALCEALTVCSAGGAVLGGIGGMGVTLGRRAGIVAEGTFSEQFWSARARPGFEEETALRLSRMALLFRYGAPTPGRFAYMPVAGLSRTRGNVRGLSHVTGVLVPVGGYHQVARTATRMGLTVGLDLAQATGLGFGISVPIRLTRMMGERPDHWPAMFDAQVGVGISVPVARRVRMR